MTSTNPADIAFARFLKEGIRDQGPSLGLTRQIVLVGILDHKAKGGDLSYALERAVDRFSRAFDGPKATMTTAASYARAVVFYGQVDGQPFSAWLKALPVPEAPLSAIEKVIAAVDVREALGERASRKKTKRQSDGPRERLVLAEVHGLMKQAQEGDPHAAQELTFIKTLLSA
jgi:hypothetical protein